MNKKSKLDLNEFIDHDFPSTLENNPWVCTSCLIRRKHQKKSIGSKAGKWLIFVDKSEVDIIWQRVKKATKEGLLGHSSKASTAQFNPNSNSKTESVICVYTYNWEDVEDVYRVEKAIRQIGVELTLYYKTNLDTANGNYTVNGFKGISKYISKSINNDNNSLSSLHGIGNEKINTLHKININTIDDLLNFDTTQNIENIGITTKYVKKIKLLALSKIENKIYRIKEYLPENEITHFDIETDLSSSYLTKRVWSIAVYHNNKVTRFFAKSWDKEKNILKKFLNFIQNQECKNLYCYSGSSFDKNVLTAAFKRHNINPEYFINCTHKDLCTILKQHYIFPLKSYGLKEIAKYLNYNFKNEHFDGLYVASCYIHCQSTGKKIPKNIFQYIDDDVKAMEHIIKTIYDRTDIIDISTI